MPWHENEMREKGTKKHTNYSSRKKRTERKIACVPNSKNVRCWCYFSLFFALFFVFTKKAMCGTMRTEEYERHIKSKQKKREVYFCAIVWKLPFFPYTWIYFISIFLRFRPHVNVVECRNFAFSSSFFSIHSSPSPTLFLTYKCYSLLRFYFGLEVLVGSVVGTAAIGDFVICLKCKGIRYVDWVYAVDCYTYISVCVCINSNE